MTSPTDLMRLKDAKKALAWLEQSGFSARLAGGCVRDRLMELVPKDFDIATTATPEEVCTVFKQKNVKSIPTGMDHGTISVIFPSGPIEITTLRKDVATDGRRATVVFSHDFKEDALRRDFTINAMYEDRAGEIFDYYGGQEDLRNKVMRFVGDPEERIREDYLRILRMFRFWSRFGFEPEKKGLQACTKLCSGIEHLSLERVTSELLQILAGKHVAAALNAMHRTGVWDACRLPIDLDKVNSDFLAQCHTTHNQGLARLLNCSLQAGLTDAKSLISQLRLDNKSITVLTNGLNHLQHLPNRTDDNATIMEWFDQLETPPYTWPGFFAPIMRAIPGSDQTNIDALTQFDEKYGGLRRSTPPVSGKDLIQAGFPSGPSLGTILAKLKSEYRNQIWQTKAEGLKRAEELKLRTL